MIEHLKRFFAKRPAEGRPGRSGDAERDTRVAVCALMVELARIDEAFSEQELAAVIGILQQKYGLAAEHAEALLAEATAELEQSVDLWQFARRINENYTNDEKLEIVELLWRIVYVDGRLDDHEHYLMHKLKNLLRLSHPQLIEAKLKVLHGA